MQLNVTNNDPRDNTDAGNDMINDTDIDFLMEIEEDVAGRLDNRTNEGNPSIYYIGPMSLLCPYCSALRFPNKLLNCYHKGKVTLAMDVHPEDLRSLFQKKQFLDKTRSYNNVFAFASLGAQMVPLQDMVHIVSGFMVKYTIEVVPCILLMVREEGMDKYIFWKGLRHLKCG